MGTPPYQRVHVVINPASGKDEPILNVLNDVFHGHGVDWSVSVTHKYGDASEQARAAIADGVDLVVGYGGDGTQHELGNAIVGVAATTGRAVPLGVLPGGTGNGFARELGVPRKLRDAAVVLCESTRTRAIDVGRLREIDRPEVDDRYFVQRLYVGVEPEEQTSRDMKNRYGVFAYAINAAHRGADGPAHHYRARVDDEELAFDASTVYLVNSGMMGTGVRITHTYAIDDGLLDCFAVDKHATTTLVAAAARLLPVQTALAGRYTRLARSVDLAVEPDQAVWADGEYIGRTPISVDVLPGALTVVVP